MKHVVLSFTFLVSLLFASAVSAEQFTFHKDNIDTCNNFGIPASNLGNKNIKVKYIDFIYDDQSETFTAEVQVDNSRSKIANFFHLVLTSGSMPQGEAAAAHLYFDASDLNNPKVNVFSYNGGGNNTCANSPGSWDTEAQGIPSFNPDPILNDQNSAAVLEATAAQSTVGGNLTRTFRVTVDATKINDFRPSLQDRYSYSYPYRGLNFGKKIGVWFWAAANAGTGYNNSGYLNRLDTTECAICDQTDFETKQAPVCSGSSATLNPVAPGETTTMTIEVSDPDCNDVEKADLILTSLTGLPAGAKSDVGIGSKIAFNSQCKGEVKITWTPVISQAGKHQVTATFSKDYGLDQLVAQCAGVEVDVTPDAPQCKEADTDPLTQADQDIAEITRIAQELERKTKRLMKKLGRKNTKVDNFDAPLENLIGWESYNAIVNVQTYYFECTNTDFCGEGLRITNLSGELATFQSAVDTLEVIAISRANQFEKFRRKFLRKVKDFGRRKAKRKAARQANRFRNNIIATGKSASSQVNLHIANYGIQRISCDKPIS